MFTISDIKTEFERLDKITGANIAQYPIRISRKCIYKRGSFKYNYKTQDNQLVFYNKKFMFADFVLADTQENFINTVRHEYAHALALYIYKCNNINHGEKWVKCCHIVNCIPSATTNKTCSEQLERIKRHNNKKRIQYKVSCTNCDKSWIYKKKNNLIKSILGNYDGIFSCPYCNNTHFTFITYRE